MSKNTSFTFAEIAEQFSVLGDMFRSLDVSGNAAAPAAMETVTSRAAKATSRAAKATTSDKAVSAKAPEAVAPADDDGDESDEEYRLELEGMTIRELRALARENDVTLGRGLDKPGVIEAIIDAQYEPEDGDVDEPVDNADDNGDSAELDDADLAERRDELMSMNLRALRGVARDDAGIAKDQYNGLDKNDLVDLILDAEVNAEDAGAEEGDYPRYSSSDLQDFELDELLEIAGDWGVKTSGRSTAKTVIPKIIDAQDAHFGDDEGDDDDDE